MGRIDSVGKNDCCNSKKDLQNFDYNNSLQNIFENSISDYFTHHNMALDTLDVAKKEGLSNSPTTLIRFDAHRDMLFQEVDKSQNIGTYVNTILKNENIKDVYNVIYNDQQKEKDQPSIVIDYPKNRIIYVDKSANKLLFEKPADYDKNPSKYREINYHETSIEDLPSFKNKKGIMLDIDADYFDDSSSNINYTKEELKNKIENFVETLDEKGIKPEITTCAISPGWTKSNSVNYIERFFQDINEKSSIDDLLMGYRRNNPEGSISTQNPNKSFSGKNIKRDEDPLYRTLYDMRFADMHSNQDNIIKIDENDKEYKDSINAVMHNYDINEKEAKEKLFELDKMDGEKNNIINPNEIEKKIVFKSDYYKDSIFQGEIRRWESLRNFYKYY
jgi:hypothetical protein